MDVTRTCLLAVCVWAVGCSSSDRSGEARDKTPEKTTEVIGIDPLIYKCDNLVTVEDIAGALGGEISIAEVAFEPPPGTPEPCHYLRAAEDTQQPWSFDIDCRDDALRTAEALFEQYGATMNDAGVAAVDVGRQAIDHHGQSILFIDNDAPCFVRVHGPTAEGRLGLASLLADRLVPKNAPMRPRPAR